MSVDSADLTVADIMQTDATTVKPDSTVAQPADLHEPARPIATGTACPRDEAVVTVSAAARGPGPVVGAEVACAERQGARDRLEVNVSFSW